MTFVLWFLDFLDESSYYYFNATYIAMPSRNLFGIINGFFKSTNEDGEKTTLNL